MSPEKAFHVVLTFDIAGLCCLVTWFLWTHWSDLGLPVLHLKSRAWAFLNREPQDGANEEHIVPNWMRLSIYPDFIIGGAHDPYINRWYLLPMVPLSLRLGAIAAGIWLHHPWILVILFNGYLHNIVRSDDDRALHDHPWANLSILLSGWYQEVAPDWEAMAPGDRVTPTSPTITHIREAGDIVFRKASDPHRLEILDEEAWSLFLIGPNTRSWGFLCPDSWRYWKEFVGADTGTVGRGCD